MRWQNKIKSYIQLLFLIASTASLASCAVTDSYGSRASSFNNQAAESKRGVILSNIVRSAYLLPLQFTDVTTVTGQTSSLASISSSFPFFLNGNGNLLAGVTPSANIQGSAQFNIVNQSTQEFYNGMQEPISKQLVAFYLNSGFPPRVLLPLVISEIEVVNGGLRTRIVNSPLHARGFRSFNSALQVLIANGLSAEQVSASTPLGPVLSASQAADARIQAQIIAAGSDAPTLEKVAGGYQLQRGSKGFAFCFDPLKFQGSGPYSDHGVLSGPSGISSRVLEMVLLTASEQDFANTRVGIDPSHFCSNKDAISGDDRSARQKIGLNISIKTRSVEQIFTYLGEISRTELGLASTPEPLDLRDYNNNSYRLFRLHQGLSSRPYVSTNIDGQTFSIRVDPSGQDESGRVLQLLTDLLALQSSSKAQPAPTVISVINQ